MEKFNEFFQKYKGMIIGAIVAILILFTNIYKLVIGIILIFIGMFARKLCSTQ